MRKLASIQRITKLEPIPGADAIEKAHVLGWELVVKKGEFQEHDLCVYCEIDSILPDKPQFEFLRDRKFRIKTIKLRGQLSQGICFSFNTLPEMKQKYSTDTGYYWDEGEDVTELLGIKKHDPEAALEQKLADEQAKVYKNRLDKFLKRYNWYRRLVVKKNRLPFPTWICNKTDETRIQNFPNICSDHEGVVFTHSEKLDGQSGTFFIVKNPKLYQFWKPYLFGVCSRNFQLVYPDDSSYWDVAKKYKIKNGLIKLIKQYNRVNKIAIQGEICGPKIQGNKYQLTENKLFLFNIIYDNRPIYPIYETANFLGLDTVPDLGNIKLYSTISDMVNYSKGYSRINPNTIREGVVIRNYQKNISFKVINPDFLLKSE